MKVSWEMLSNDDANGVITKYEVCYKASEDITDIDCNLKKMINDSNAREVALDGLNEATAYNVAVRASTAEGFGNLGDITSQKTRGAGEYFLFDMLGKRYSIAYCLSLGTRNVSFLFQNYPQKYVRAAYLDRSREQDLNRNLPVSGSRSTD